MFLDIVGVITTLKLSTMSKRVNEITMKRGRGRSVTFFEFKQGIYPIFIRIVINRRFTRQQSSSSSAIKPKPAGAFTSMQVLRLIQNPFNFEMT